MTVSNPESLDSPIEDIWAYHSSKYLAADCSQSSQVEIHTICGVFRPDFIISHRSGLSIAVECDGKDFHDEHRDEWRDAMILGDSHLQGILRFRGIDINNHIDDLIYLMSQAYSKLFSYRAHVNLRQLASFEARQYDFDACDTSWTVAYKNEPKMVNILLGLSIAIKIYLKVEGNSGKVPTGSQNLKSETVWITSWKNTEKPN